MDTGNDIALTEEDFAHQDDGATGAFNRRSPLPEVDATAEAIAVSTRGVIDMLERRRNAALATIQGKHADDRAVAEAQLAALQKQIDDANYIVRQCTDQMKIIQDRLSTQKKQSDDAIERATRNFGAMIAHQRATLEGVLALDAPISSVQQAFSAGVKDVE